MKKLLLAASAAALLTASLTAAHLSVPSEAADDMIKIMCIGDSITDGYFPEYTGSYRKFLYNDLKNMGYSIDMVGAKDGGWTPTYTDSKTGDSFEFDNENTGYSGYAISEYSGRNGILETLKSTGCLELAPDIVTLQIGTNDVIDNHEIDSAGERLEVLVDYILANIPENSALFVTTIPNADPNRSDVYDWFGNYRHSPDWQIQYSDEDAEKAVAASVSSYNSQVKTLVEGKKAAGANIYFADVNSIITDVKIQLADGVHPNNIGYKAMGSYWSGIIGEYLGGSTSEPAQDKFTAEDLRKVSSYLLGDSENGALTNEELIRYDTDKNEIVNIFDLIRMRKNIS